MDVGLGREGVQAEAAQRQRLCGGREHGTCNKRAEAPLGRNTEPRGRRHIHAGLQRTLGIRGFSAALCEHFGGKR